MNVLFPVFFGAALMVGLPLLLHVLRVYTRVKIAFPTLHFLGSEAVRDNLRHRIRRWLVLLLRALFILLVVLAFARPYWLLEHTDESRAVVVVVDNSYSMQAEGRIAAVQAWLAPQLAALKIPDQLGVLILHPTPEWIVPLSGDLAAGRLALQEFPKAYEVSRFRPGLELAAAALSQAKTKHRQILLASDGQRLGWSDVRFERSLPPAVEFVACPPLDAPARQAAVVSFRAMRTSAGSLLLEAEVMGFGAEEHDRTVTFMAGDTVLGRVECGVARGKAANVRGEYKPDNLDNALVLRATLDPDSLPLDDVAYAVLPASHDRRVMLAQPNSSAGADFLAVALAAANRVSKKTVELATLPPAGEPWPTSSVAVLRGPAPFRDEARPSLDAFVAAGGSAWIICDGSPEQVKWLGEHGVNVTPLNDENAALKLRDFALDHPLFAPFASHDVSPLLAVRFRRGWALAGPSIEALARWPNREVAVAEVPTRNGRILITGFSETREDSNLPLSVTYVPLCGSAIEWLTNDDRSAGDSGRVGEVLALAGAGAWKPVMSPAAGDEVMVRSWVTPTVPGVYSLEHDGKQRFYAVNLDTTESDLAPWPTPDDFQLLVSDAPVAPATLAKTTDAEPKPVFDPSLVDERDAWWWLLLAALGILLIELGLANRTIP